MKRVLLVCSIFFSVACNAGEKGKMMAELGRDLTIILETLPHGMHPLMGTPLSNEYMDSLKDLSKVATVTVGKIPLLRLSAAEVSYLLPEEAAEKLIERLRILKD